MTKNEELKKYLGRGYNIVLDSKDYITLERPKKFSVIWAFLWFCMGGVGILVYILYYILMPKKKITIAK